MKKNKKILIVGAGITGITLAERFANVGNTVLIIEKREQIGGNCYDYKNDNNLLVHKYGPHIFHTDYKDVWNYLSKFTEWIPYKHKVTGLIDGKNVPIPFNLDTLNKLIPEKSEKLEKKLINYFGKNKKVTILDLKKLKDSDFKFLANFIYEKVFLYYTQKQWGLKPEKIDPSVTARVPINISQEDGYFFDKYQAMPKNGYTAMFKKMLAHKNIKINLNTDYKKNKNNTDFDLIYYSGPIDEFFNYEFGRLEYRCFKLMLKTFNKKDFQPSAVVNYPDLEHRFTRTTEFKKLTMQKNSKTIIAYEYPGKTGYVGWPFLNDKNNKILSKYNSKAKKIKKVTFVGRLGEFKYYDMDDAINNALNIFNKNNHGK
ncbi:MAG: UDP-galactopyranose mutase [Patescibacteria group bacterium]